MAEDIRFRLLAEDQASGAFLKTGRAAAAASDDVLGLARRLDEVGKKSATARVGLAGNKEAMAQLDKLDLKALTVGRRVIDPKINIGGAAKADAEIFALEAKLDGLIVKSGEATAATGAGSGGLAGVSGIGALIVAGAVLSPIITTLAFGTAGFGAAAAGAILPISKAAQATGGLQANMAKLNPEQQQLAQSILGLGKQYHAFEGALQPQVLAVFGQGIKLAGTLMHQVEPVAKATGVAIGGLLGAVDAEFKSGTWTQFFSFMAQTAGPDIALLKTSFISLLDALPGLLQALQPVAVEILKVVAAGARLADISSHVIGAVDGSAHSTNRWATTLFRTGRILAFTAIPQLLGLKLAVDKLAGPTTTMTAKTSIFAGTLKSVKTALVPVGRNAFVLGNQAQAAASQVTKLNTAWSTFVGASAGVEAAQLAVITNLRQMSKDARAAGASFTGVNAASITLQTDFESNLVPSIQSVIGSAKTAGAKTHDLAVVISTDLKPAADKGALANKGMRQQIYDMAVQAGYTGPNKIGPLTGFIDRNATSLRKADKITSTWAQDLGKIPKHEHTSIGVTGTGSWQVNQAGTIPGSGGGHHFTAAAGMLVSGGIPGRDSVHILAQQDELVVPVPIVRSGAVDHLRGQIPGFAAGGVVGSYAGGVPGLGKWLASEDSATLRAIESSVARATFTGMRAASSGAGAGGAGVARWAPLILRVLAMLGQPAGDLGPVEHRMAQESGGNPLAINQSDINFAMGDPSRGLMQTIGSTFAAYAGPFRSLGIYNPEANIYAGLNYALHAYPGRSLASVMLQSGGYDSGTNYLPRGASIAINNTGRPERVGGEDLGPLLREVIRLLRQAPAATGEHMGRALQGTARRAGASGQYSRGGF